MFGMWRVVKIIGNQTFIHFGVLGHMLCYMMKMKSI